MKIKAEKKVLLKALSRIQGIVEKTSIKPITANVLIEASQSEISVSATNLQIGMTATYSEVNVIETGTLSINARKLYEIIKELPEQEILLEEKDNYRIDITCGEDVCFKIIGLPPEDFPMFVKEDYDSFILWDIEKFLRMIDLTSFSISRDETKLNISGAYIENTEQESVRIVTTDGYRISIVDEFFDNKLSIEEGFIIPSKGILELHKILHEKKEVENIAILIKKNNLIVRAGEVQLFVRLIEKKFPDYKVILPEEGYKNISVRIPKEQIRPSIKRMSIISSENNRPVVFSFKENIITIFTEDNELGSVNEQIKIEEKVIEEFNFCINGMYLLEVLNAVEDDVMIEYNMEEENKPILVKPCNRKNIIYIIMPMIMN